MYSLERWGCQEGDELPGRVDALARDPAEVVDVVRGRDVGHIARDDEVVQVRRHAVLPQHTMAVAVGVTGLADDLAPLVDPGRLAREVAGECIELTHSAAPGPDERAGIEVAPAGGGRVGVYSHGSFLVVGT